MRIFVALLSIALFLNTPASAAELDIPAIETQLGQKGSLNPIDKVYTVNLPRDDVKITIDGAALPPFMGNEGWVAFKGGRGEKNMLMGDVVLLADEVNAALDAALESRIGVTSLGNRNVTDEPRTFYMHLDAEGTPAELASGMKKVLEAIARVRSAPPSPRSDIPATPAAITPAPLDAIFGQQGETKDGMYRQIIGREVEMPCACRIGAGMGIASSAAFAGTDGRAIVTGDFACSVGQLEPVLRALRAGRISVTAIQNRMESEAPRLIFVHYHGIGKAIDLATAIKTALDTQPRAVLDQLRQQEGK